MTRVKVSAGGCWIFLPWSVDEVRDKMAEAIDRQVQLRGATHREISFRVVGREDII